MELKNYLVELLSNIIHDRLKLLSDTKNDMKKTEDYKRIEELFSDINNIKSVSNDDLRDVLSNITDDDTIDGIISNIDMIKIVLNGIDNGLDLSIDDSQKDLVNGVYEIVNNFRTELESKSLESKKYLDEFISKCQGLSSEISTGVVRDINTLDEIFNENDVSLDNIIKCKFEILENNNRNYNLELDGKVKEEVDLRLFFKKINVEFEDFSEFQRKVLVSYSDLNNIEEMFNFISDNNLEFSIDQLFILICLSNTGSLSNIIEISDRYKFDINKLFMMPGIFVPSENKNIFETISNELKDDEMFYTIENMKYIGSYYENFISNIKILESNNKDVLECYNTNMLSLIIPDMEKNLTILSDMNLSDKEFSIVVINPFLATSRSSFQECGLSEYLKTNPLRLCTSYYRLRKIASAIVLARKNGDVIFRSLSDKKNYWLSKNITSCDSREVI